MIPLSLYVTIELCKILQVYHIHNNVDLFDMQTNKRTECRAMNITEELGQVCNLLILVDDCLLDFNNFTFNVLGSTYLFG